jgi:hypothetical protein
VAAVEVKVGRAAVKLRRPWVVGALSLIPFYWVYWYYAINREMRDFGRARGNAQLGESKPARSVVAVTAGALVMVPWIVSVWRSVRRIEACERLAGARPASSALVLCLLLGGSLAAWIGAFVGHGAIGIVLAYVGIPATIAASVLMQIRLTRLWAAG